MGLVVANCGTTLGCRRVVDVVAGNGLNVKFSILNEVLRKMVVKTKGWRVVVDFLETEGP